APGGSEGSRPEMTRVPTQVFSGLPETRYLSRNAGHGIASGTGCGSPPKLSVIVVMYASNVTSAWNGGPKMWMSAPREIEIDTCAQAPKKQTSIVSDTPTSIPPRKS